MTVYLNGFPWREGDYFDRPPERLVLEGYRHWVAGIDNNSVVPWELAWNLYVGILGVDRAKPALAELAHFIRIVGRCATCPLMSFPSGAHHLCREECLTLGLISGAQHGDDIVVRKCLHAMTCPARCEPVAMAAGSFAVSPDLERIAVSSPAGGVVMIIERAGGKVLQIRNIAKAAGLTSVGHEFVASSSNGTIAIIDQPITICARPYAFDNHLNAIGCRNGAGENT